MERHPSPTVQNNEDVLRSHSEFLVWFSIFCSLEIHNANNNVISFNKHQQPNRTYYLEDVDRKSIAWVDTINQIRKLHKK
eukprot:m.162585 g.162585  ORF g.162585 m.162585 type:complete len:80 (-) comp13407_c0_seq10:139-378(-)